MRTILAASMLVLMPVAAIAQVNTTGSLSGNTTGSLSDTVLPSVPASTSTAAPATATTQGTAVAALPAARDAAIVLCGQDFTTGGGALLVFSASVSANSPVAAPGAPCAQALADLFAAGFSVIDVQPFNQQLQYTLVR